MKNPHSNETVSSSETIQSTKSRYSQYAGIPGAALIFAALAAIGGKNEWLSPSETAPLAGESQIAEGNLESPPNWAKDESGALAATLADVLESSEYSTREVTATVELSFETAPEWAQVQSLSFVASGTAADWRVTEMTNRRGVGLQVDEEQITLVLPWESEDRQFAGSSIPFPLFLTPTTLDLVEVLAVDEDRGLVRLTFPKGWGNFREAVIDVEAHTGLIRSVLGVLEHANGQGLSLKQTVTRTP